MRRPHKTNLAPSAANLRAGGGAEAGGGARNENGR